MESVKIAEMEEMVRILLKRKVSLSDLMHTLNQPKEVVISRLIEVDQNKWVDLKYDHLRHRYYALPWCDLC